MLLPGGRCNSHKRVGFNQLVDVITKVADGIATKGLFILI